MQTLVSYKTASLNSLTAIKIVIICKAVIQIRPVCHSHVPFSIPVHLLSDSWWTEWHWDRLSSISFNFCNSTHVICRCITAREMKDRSVQVAHYHILRQWHIWLCILLQSKAAVYNTTVQNDHNYIINMGVCILGLVVAASWVTFMGFAWNKWVKPQNFHDSVHCWGQNPLLFRMFPFKLSVAACKGVTQSGDTFYVLLTV